MSSRIHPWIDPTTLPSYGSISHIDGTAPPYIKHLTQNTLFSYGVGVGLGPSQALEQQEFFAYNVGMKMRVVDVSVGGADGRLEATTVVEVVVGKGMLNGAGMLHGGCLAYLIDNCCSTPLVALGLMQGVNGVGVTQSMNVLFHSPASRGTTLSIISTSIALGGRVMTSRCEIIAKETGRIVASAFLNKMQPAATSSTSSSSSSSSSTSTSCTSSSLSSPSPSPSSSATFNASSSGGGKGRGKL